MKTKHLALLLISATFSATLLAQGDRGSITGAVVDQAGALVAGASVVAKNTETQVTYPTATTNTGDYTLQGIPIGSYNLTVTVSGFKTFVENDIRVYVGQVSREDARLQVGDTKQEVTVTAESALLETESAEQSQNVTVEALDSLPVNYNGLGNSSTGNIRNPFTFVDLVPGGSVSSYSTITIQGSPSNTFYVNVEGQQANNNRLAIRQDQVEPSVESLEEVSVVTSNFAPEFGQVAGGYINVVTKSGSDRIHGSLFEYWTNEDLGAGQPFTNNGNGHLLRPPNRKNDFGGSFGGPVIIPKIYNGRHKTFFFFTNENYYQNQTTSGVLQTVPTAAMRMGVFSQSVTGKVLGTDPLSRQIIENTIYDPTSFTTTASGQVVTNPFPNNAIPVSRIDQVAMKIQALLPQPTTGGLLNNWNQSYASPTEEWIPTIKVDQNFTDKDKMTFYFSKYYGPHYNGLDGLPEPITTERKIFTNTETYRINYDRTISTRLLLHVGIGDLWHRNPDLSTPPSLNYNPLAGLGLMGAVYNTGFPNISGLSGTTAGGMGLGIGANLGLIEANKPTAVANVTYIRGSHNYKFGSDWRVDVLTQQSYNSESGSYTFNAAQTGLPYLNGTALPGGSAGIPYASFLLGLVNTATVGNPSAPQARKLSLGMFAQDTWKVNRKFTLTYGLRWDFQEYPDEIHARESAFSTLKPNPSAGGLPGALIYEGNSPGACQCRFVHTYPYALGPRLGVAYQINDKTVFRGGWGVTYAETAGGQSTPTSTTGAGGWNTISFSNPTYGSPALILQNGLQYNPATLFQQTLNAGYYPQAGQINNPPPLIDVNAGRPPRLIQWNASLQRQIFPSLVAELAYVGNTGAWFEDNNLINLNAITPQRLTQFGLSLNVPGNLTLLTSQLGSGSVKTAGYTAPYAGFPLTSTLAQALRPFPQMGTIAITGAPLGDTHFNSLQGKLTKRLSHGLDMSANFVWSSQLDDMSGVNNPFNRPNQMGLSSMSVPLQTTIAWTYRVPAAPFLKKGSGFASGTMRAALMDWTFGAILHYASGAPIAAPVAQNNLSSDIFMSTYFTRVPGVPLFLKNLNCHCIDPNSDLVLNTAAWQEPAAGQWGQSAIYFNDYRQARQPSETANLGRVFRIREKIQLAVRVEVVNIFNRVYLAAPSSTNPLATTTHNSTTGVLTGGFGYINATGIVQPPRTGQLVGRITF
jgi:hypothetical protein